MILDTSALLAILQLEPEAERLARAMALDSHRLISASNWLEASIVVFLRAGEEGLRDLDLLMAKFQIETVSVTPGQAEIARRAFRQYGKGIHPARQDRYSRGRVLKKIWPLPGIGQPNQQAFAEQRAAAAAGAAAACCRSVCRRQQSPDLPPYLLPLPPATVAACCGWICIPGRAPFVPTVVGSSA